MMVEILIQTDICTLEMKVQKSEDDAKGAKLAHESLTFQNPEAYERWIPVRVKPPKKNYPRGLRLM